jgi:hypothetical protein
MVAAPQFVCRRSDRATDRQAPHSLIFFQIIQNWFKLVKSKWMSYIAKQIPKFYTMLDWSIRNNFLNCTEFKFPIEITL